MYYIFNFTNKGYVIVSADDGVPPVLAYSFEGNYSPDNQPPQFINWMEGYAKQIDQVISILIILFMIFIRHGSGFRRVILNISTTLL